MTNAAAEIRLRKKMTLAVAKRKSKTREVGEEVMREGGGKERERERERELSVAQIYVGEND